MYVTLEPCCHHGRTPPCTDAIVNAGIKRIVVASDDPTDKASGRGLGILRDEGVDVEVVDGEVSHAARLLNQPFRKHARTGRPHVLFKSAMSLDGKVATQTGDSKWISGEESRGLVHRWRAEVGRGLRRDRDGACRRPAADGAHARRGAAAGAGRVRLRGAAARRRASSPARRTTPA